MIKRFLICLSLILGGCYVEVRPYPSPYIPKDPTVIVVPDGRTLYKITFSNGIIDHVTAYSYDGAVKIARIKWPNYVVVKVEVVLIGE